MFIQRKSPITGQLATMEINVTHAQLDAWNEGTLIQNAMPNLTADEREFIMTGMTAEDWDNMCGDEEIDPDTAVEEAIAMQVVK